MSAMKKPLFFIHLLAEIVRHT